MPARKNRWGVGSPPWRIRTRLAATIGFTAAFAPAVIGQTSFCLRDADGDGHPLLGNPQTRPFPETQAGLTFGNWSTSVAFADLDGDGDPDAVVADAAGTPPGGATQSFVSVLLNVGDGVFAPGGLYAAARRPCSVELADLDADGDRDIAATGELQDVVSILMNKGDGTFAPYTTLPVGHIPCSLKISDLDGDGDRDLVVLNSASNDVSILRNGGGGAFAPEVRVFVGSVTPRGYSGLNFPYPGPFLAVGDLDGDGDPDVAVPAKSKIKLLLNDGLGALSLAATHPSVALPSAYSVVIADLDGDADADLAASSLYSTGGPNCLSVVMNQGSGVFAPPVAYDAGWSSHPGSVQWATSLTAGDLEDDGDIDLGVGHEIGDSVMLMRNRGDGTLAAKQPVHVYGGPWYVRFVEANGDSLLDLGALSFAVRSKLCVLLNDGAGSPLAINRYPSDSEGEFWNWVEAADLDNDGDLDLVAANQGSGDPQQVKVLLNDGYAAFEKVGEYSLGPPGASTGESVAIGDLNGDELADLVIADAIAPGGWQTPGKIWTMLGLGDGAFQAPSPYPLPGVSPMQMVIADFDADADNDVAVGVVEIHPGSNVTPVWRRILVFTNSGTGAISLSGALPVLQCPWHFPRAALAVADLNADGRPDLVGAGGTWRLPGAMAVFFNNGSGGFVQHQTAAVPPQPESLAVADLNADGHDDLVLLHNHNFADGVLDKPYVSTWINDGTGTLIAGPVRIDARMLPFGRIAAVGSPHGDATLLASPNAFGAVVIDTLSRSLTFGDPVNYGTGYLPTASVFADFDDDGRIDLAVSAGNDSSVSILLNRSCGACPADCNATGTLSLDDFQCFLERFREADPYADCNNDKALTIADFACFQRAFVSGCP